MDHFAFASLAQINILLVPVGSITKLLFDKWAAEIRSFNCIPLGDITVGDKDQRGVQRAFAPRSSTLTPFSPAHFLPTANTSGHRPPSPQFPVTSSPRISPPLIALHTLRVPVGRHRNYLMFSYTLAYLGDAARCQHTKIAASNLHPVMKTRPENIVMHGPRYLVLVVHLD